MNTLGYIVGRIWSGNTSLAKLYWGYGVVGGFFWGVIFLFVTPGSSGAIATCVGYTAFSIILSVGLWRAAERYQGWFIWAGVARVAAVFGGIQSILLAGILVFSFGEAIVTALKPQQDQIVSTPISVNEFQKEKLPTTIAPQSYEQKNHAQYVDPLDRELAIMDQMHPGWRQKVMSPQFSEWLSRQNQATKINFESAETAAELSVVINQFDTWIVAQQKAQAHAQARAQKERPPPDSPEKIDRIFQQMSDWDNRHAQKLDEWRN